MNTDISELSKSFVDQIQSRNKIRLDPFDQYAWFKGAYSTFQRTLRDGFVPLSPEEKMRLCELIFDEYLAPRSHSDAQIDRLVVKIASSHKISIGHSQKLVAMLGKYAYVSSSLKSSLLPDRVYEFVRLNASLLPIPVDNYVLAEIYRVHAEKFPELVKRGNSHYVSTGGNTYAWSRLPDITVWRSIQSRLREMATVAGVTPMEFEMRHLWVKPT